ncbi:MipA/OmpV family protein [Pelagimonas varians]|uniref:MltA-interacting protein MipA n=1 Tax=Pelagimonas varians TaxID=696760 RepID=A0A238L5I2_9RHOB|nr:MipA/OmpV family protein [Pelagimonas varians]PYG25533.1 outer membrane scaffolding protein for murein synthesis (MipA/OmpV family) [Pelagimonas varians]SMX50238.1 MltA-interacting protein MipA [Pelagimonas varians]
MIKHAMFAILLTTLPQHSLAQDSAVPSAEAPAASAKKTFRPDLVFYLGAGATASPTYFGSDNYEVTPDIEFGFRFLRLPGDNTFGSTDPDYEPRGFSPRGSLRVVKKRSSDDHAELAGLEDVDMSIEVGLGIGYQQRNFRAYADARYGLLGHESWVGEFGADYVARPMDGWLLTLGPRVLVGDDKYASTYFGVTPSESAASSGRFESFDASGGLMSAGIELASYYSLNEKWGLVGSARWETLLNDAADSPITTMGSEDQFTVSFGLTRLFSLDF